MYTECLFNVILNSEHACSTNNNNNNNMSLTAAKTMGVITITKLVGSDCIRTLIS